MKHYFHSSGWAD